VSHILPSSPHPSNVSSIAPLLQVSSEVLDRASKLFNSFLVPFSLPPSSPGCQLCLFGFLVLVRSPCFEHSRCLSLYISILSSSSSSCHMFVQILSLLLIPLILCSSLCTPTTPREFHRPYLASFFFFCHIPRILSRVLLLVLYSPSTIIIERSVL
jgi:hypothetical protein